MNKKPAVFDSRTGVKRRKENVRPVTGKKSCLVKYFQVMSGR